MVMAHGHFDKSRRWVLKLRTEVKARGTFDGNSWEESLMVASAQVEVVSWKVSTK